MGEFFCGSLTFERHPRGSYRLYRLCHCSTLDIIATAKFGRERERESEEEEKHVGCLSPARNTFLQ